MQLTLNRKTNQMNQIKIRCSSIGHLMTEPVKIDESLITPEIQAVINKKVRTDDEKKLIAILKASTLSVGAKTHMRSIASQMIYGVEFEVSSKYMEKGNLVELDSIDMLNRVRGLNLVKNDIRKENEFISGECDLFDAKRKRGHDIKSAWSVATFPICQLDCIDSMYEWQMRGYMMLWDAEEWEVNYCLVDTPEALVGFEAMPMHLVSHIPENMRITTWNLKRDRTLEDAMKNKVVLARQYLIDTIKEFDRTHSLPPAPTEEVEFA
jgi:hypothetical protein